MVDETLTPEERIEFDVVIVGGGPAGLSAAIKLRQLNDSLQVCLLEKGSAIGSHILSGNIFEPRALNELFPDWQERGAPLTCPVQEDKFSFLTEKRRFPMPTPPQMNNHGNYIISLGNLCAWLAAQAEQLGVTIFPDNPAVSTLTDSSGKVIGVKCGEKGLDRDGLPTSSYVPGYDIYAKQVILAEGCRGQLSEQVMIQYNLREGVEPQTYGLGFKEVWEVPADQHQEGRVEHFIGWPMDHQTYGGGFLYHAPHRQIYVGYVIGLDYQNPYLSPFKEFQRFKTHPSIRSLLEGGRRIAYGARALNEGGWQSIPKLVFPGGVLVGCAAGFMNVPKIKGSHTAMKSAMLAAEAVIDVLRGGENHYEKKLQESWVYAELKKVRNIRPGFQKGLSWGLVNAAWETYITRGRSPWTLSHHKDHERLKPIGEVVPIDYPKPDGVFSFDLLSSVYLANTHHVETQPNHLKLRNPAGAISHNYKVYGSPEQRYCPAGVYEIIEGESGPYLQINSANCIHCKTCDIKDPLQNIHWTCPEGSSGPNYTGM